MNKCNCYLRSGSGYQQSFKLRTLGKNVTEKFTEKVFFIFMNLKFFDCT